jgi:pentatricopeptide repeat protein
VSWNALIAGFARKGEGETTLMTFAGMQRNGFEATHFTYASVFKYVSKVFDREIVVRDTNRFLWRLLVIIMLFNVCSE